MLPTDHGVKTWAKFQDNQLIAPISHSCLQTVLNILYPTVAYKPLSYIPQLPTTRFEYPITHSCLQIVILYPTVSYKPLSYIPQLPTNRYPISHISLELNPNPFIKIVILYLIFPYLDKQRKYYKIHMK